MQSKTISENSPTDGEKCLLQVIQPSLIAKTTQLPFSEVMSNRCCSWNLRFFWKCPTQGQKTPPTWLTSFKTQLFCHMNFANILRPPFGWRRPGFTNGTQTGQVYRLSLHLFFFWCHNSFMIRTSPTALSKGCWFNCFTCQRLLKELIEAEITTLWKRDCFFQADCTVIMKGCLATNIVAGKKNAHIINIFSLFLIYWCSQYNRGILCH